MTATPSPQSIGKAIRQARERCELTRKQLAYRHDYTFGQIKDWETGTYTPNVRSLYRLAGDLGTSAQALLSRAETIEADNANKEAA